MHDVLSATLILTAMFPTLDRLAQATRIKVYREFDLQNRIEGSAGFFTAALPIAVGTGTPAVSGRPVRTKM